MNSVGRGLYALTKPDSECAARLVNNRVLLDVGFILSGEVPRPTAKSVDEIPNSTTRGLTDLVVNRFISGAGSDAVATMMASPLISNYRHCRAEDRE